MQLRVTGKNIDIGESLRAQISGRLNDALDKYFEDRGWSALVTLEKHGSGFLTECRVHLHTGMDLQARGDAADAYQSFDKAAERLDKRLRRYKRRLTDHHAEQGGDQIEAARNYVIAAPSEEDRGEGTEPVEDNPVVIAENESRLRRMTVGTAVMALDLSEAPVVLFRNAGTGRLNVVYRRSDGNIGWIDPPEAGEQEARG